MRELKNAASSASERGRCTGSDCRFVGRLGGGAAGKFGVAPQLIGFTASLMKRKVNGDERLYWQIDRYYYYNFGRYFCEV